MNSLRLIAMCQRLTLVASLFLGTATVLAAPSAVSQEDLAAQKELIQVKMDALKDLQQKDMDAAKSRMDAIDKRLDDQISKMGQGVDRLGVYASILGILITTLLAGLGLLGYFTVVRRTKAEAQDAAKQWFDQNAQALKEQIAQLETKANTAHQAIDGTVADVEEHGQSAKKAVQTLQDNLGNKTGGDLKALQEAQAVVTDRAEHLKQVAESSYSFDDWNTRAHAAYTAKQLDEAALFWLKASQIPNAGSVRVAQALLNRGVARSQLGQNADAINSYDELLRIFSDASEASLKALVARALLYKGVVQGQLGKNTEAFNTYDEVLRRFGDANEAALKELVARALINKGVAQGELGQSAEAIITFDDMLHRFGNASEAALKERVLIALVNKGVAQGKLGQSEDEINTYDEVLRRFGDATEAALKEQVAMALNGLGFTFLTQAKAGWSDRDAAKALLHKALERVNQAIVKFQKSWGMALGNRAYTQWLLGNPVHAEADFAAALRAEKFGGQELYEATLKDFDIHPIPEDQGMREMVERLWAAYQQEQAGGDAHP